MQEKRICVTLREYEKRIENKARLLVYLNAQNSTEK